MKTAEAQKLPWHPKHERVTEAPFFTQRQQKQHQI